MTKANILLVDDLPANLLALEAILEGLGLNLVRANSGEEALKCLLDREFAVILLDVRMPGMDGFQTAELIRQREQTKHTPIIFVTALGTTDTQIFKGYFLGAADYLVKPIVPEILRAKVQAFVTIYQKAKETAERERAEAELAQRLKGEQQLRKVAEEANRAKDQFLAMTSHELRAPLTALHGWARLLRSGELDEATRARALDMIESNVRTQTRLIDDLLDVSRIITGKFHVYPQTIDLVPVLEAAVETIQPEAAAKGILLELKADAGNAVVSGDSSRLQQAFLNLLSNAIKFTPQGGHANVRLKRTESEVEISVSDTGKGISPEFLPDVFERFRQAENLDPSERGGLGLGLAIVHHIVELHHGTVRAQSPGEGKGSTFTLTLPCQSTLVLPTTERPASETSLVLTGLRLLVVDDHEDSREMFATVLRQFGAEVRVADSVPKAVEAFDAWRPHLLVSDLAMPDDDGYSLIQKVRALAPGKGGQIPAIALTGHAGEEQRQQAISAGFQIHLAKPVEPTTLVEVIATLTKN
jgi:signal transduction histidine kinase